MSEPDNTGLPVMIFVVAIVVGIAPDKPVVRS